MSDLTPQMMAFLTELADLFDKHRIEVEAVDNDADYYPSVDGVEITQKTDLGENFKVLTPRSMIKLGVEFDSEDIRKLIGS